jgi:hypothetical protein
MQAVAERMIQMPDEQFSNPLNQGDRRQKAAKYITSAFIVDCFLRERIALAGPPMTPDEELPEEIQAARLSGKLWLRALLDAMALFCEKAKLRFEDESIWVSADAPGFIKLVEDRRRALEDVKPDPERVNYILNFYGDLWKSQAGEDIGLLVH